VTVGPPICKEAKVVYEASCFELLVGGDIMLLSYQAYSHSIVLFIMCKLSSKLSQRTSFSRFFWMIMSWTEFMVFLSNVVSVAFVKCV